MVQSDFLIDLANDRGEFASGHLRPALTGNILDLQDHFLPGIGIAAAIV